MDKDILELFNDEDLPFLVYVRGDGRRRKVLTLPAKNYKRKCVLDLEKGDVHHIRSKEPSLGAVVMDLTLDAEVPVVDNWRAVLSDQLSQESVPFPDAWE